jgi:hypothetical protein
MTTAGVRLMRRPAVLPLRHEATPTEGSWTLPSASAGGLKVSDSRSRVPVRRVDTTQCRRNSQRLTEEDRR